MRMIISMLKLTLSSISVQAHSQGTGICACSHPPHATPKVVFKGLFSTTSRRVVAEKLGEVLHRTSQSRTIPGGLEGAERLKL